MLCRPFIILHLTYALITTTTRFFLPTPTPPPTSSSSLPFHHNHSLLSHFLNTFLLALNTVALAHTSPWLWTGPPDDRSLIWSSHSIPPRSPQQPRPAWMRGAADDRDPRVMWDLSACVVLLYVVALLLSLHHQLLFSPFTFASASSTLPPSPLRRRLLLVTHVCSVLLLLDLVGLGLFAYRLHFDCAVELSPFFLVELIRIAHTWEVMLHGGKVVDTSTAAQRLRGVDDDEKDKDEEEGEEDVGAAETAEFADLIAGAADSTGLHQRSAVAAARAAATQ